jgi:pilus assembly protein CpaF
MATLLGHCIHARANILVCGPTGSGTTSLLAALSATGGIDDRVFALQEDDEIIFQQPHVVGMMLNEVMGQEERVLRAVGLAHPDRLVVGSFAGRIAAEVVDAMGGGVEGVLSAMRAPTLRHAVARLAADLAVHRPGTTVDTAQERLASAFDLAIEIARLRDGRHRITRLAELRVEGTTLHVQDIFTFNIERTAAGGAIEGSFHPSGTVPAIVQQLSARGLLIDRTIFRRHPTR